MRTLYKKRVLLSAHTVRQDKTKLPLIYIAIRICQAFFAFSYVFSLSLCKAWFSSVRVSARVFLVNIYELTGHEAERAGKGGAV